MDLRKLQGFDFLEVNTEDSGWDGSSRFSRPVELNVINITTETDIKFIENKDPLPPTFGQWIKDVVSHIHLEKIKFTIRGCAGKFYTSWQPFIIYVENM